MGGLARILIQEGHTVTGSDKAFYPPMSDQLQELEIEVFEGYEGALPAADLYVIGNALSRGNSWVEEILRNHYSYTCLLYTSPSPRDVEESRMPSSA